MIRIAKTNSNFEREKFIAPFGFKGGYSDEQWQTVVSLETESGARAVGLGGQGILWSDAGVFSAFSQAAGNSVMFLMTEYALKKAKEIPFNTPMDLMEQLLPLVYDYGREITQNNRLRMTFALNSLVAVDNAAWLVYCKEKGIRSFDDMIPEDVRPALSFRHSKVAAIPLMSYGVGLEDVLKAVKDGYFFMKIKIGSDPEKDGDPGKMLEWDKKRLSDIHNAIRDMRTPYTENGFIPYYLDANGRYDSRDRLLRLLDHADKIGALERIMIVEEPFQEEYKIDVSDIPVRLAADESAHSDKDAVERIELGYKAIALKPIAKTVSMSFKIAKAAHERRIPCFCADLTVTPIMVDWNKNFAARLAPLPGMKIGVLETNGHQNYSRWQDLQSFHPRYGAKWIEIVDGVFNLDNDFYASSGGIFDESEHYSSII